MKFKSKNTLRSEDWTVLMQFDRNTGNILKYDMETGQLDHFSKKIIRETKSIHRLIENGMILPGGWLTLKGLKEFKNRMSRMEKSFFETENSKNNTQSIIKEDNMQGEGALSPEAEKFLHHLWNINTVEHSTADLSEDNDEIVELKDELPEKNKVSTVDKAFRSRSSKVLYDEDAIDSKLVLISSPESFEAEKFKILRTQIFFPMSGQVPKTVAVTSIVQGEGKSFVAANLAISIANDIDKYVLLIDCDLRRPKIHKLFGFKGNLQGLSEYLSGKIDLPSVLLQTKVDKLTILPAGSIPANPSELLSSDRMASMLEEVSGRYRDRMIILDTPPISVTAETSAVARLVDGVLLVVRQGYTPKGLLRDITKNIGREKIIGSVLNDVDIRSLAQYEYRKYYKSYYHSKEKNQDK